jgi:hypothetical protein
MEEGRVVELPRRKGVALGLAFVGLPLGALGVLALGSKMTMPWQGAVFFLVIGAATLGGSLRSLLARTPRLRASRDGVWFGGRRTIRWSEIEAVYASSLEVRVHGRRVRPAAISFDFVRKTTIFRLPVVAWLSSPFSVGDVDVAPGGSGDSSSALVAKLQILRAEAVPSDH